MGRGSADTMLALDPANRAGRGAHDDALGGQDAAAAVLYAAQQRAIGNAGCREDDVALGQVFKVIDAVEILDAPFLRAEPLVVVAEDEPALEPPTQRSAAAASTPSGAPPDPI